MDEEQHPINIKQEEIQELFFYLKDTYSGKNTEEIMRAEGRINHILEQHPHYIVDLFKFLLPPYTTNRNFRQSIAITIKKQLYRLSPLQQDKTEYIKALYQILQATHYEDYGVKEILGTALEYLLNNDYECKYKTPLISDVIQTLTVIVSQPENFNFESVEKVHGLCLMFLAYINSLVEPEDLLDFMGEILPLLCLAANISLHFAVNNLNSQVRESHLFLSCRLIFEIIDIAVERIMDEEDILDRDKILKISNSDMLNNVMLEILFAENVENSLISKVTTLNEIKYKILEILHLFNISNSPIPNNIVISLLYTFLFEAKKKVIEDRFEQDDDFYEQILCRVMDILESFLENKKFYSLFLNYKNQLLFALLMFSRTSPQEEANMYEEPERFVEAAEDYTESFVKPSLKVKASSFLRAFIMNIDEGASNLIEFITIFIASSLSAVNTDTPIMNQIKTQFGSHDVFGLSNREKLDVSLMVLSTVAPIINKRKNELEMVFSIFMTQHQSLLNLHDDLLIARLIRFLSYYPFALYFNMIEQKMRQSRVFFIEGLRAFERIAKNKEYLQVFPLMHTVFISIIDLIDIKDSIFEQLLFNLHKEILSKNEQLYQKVVYKIEEAFKSASNLNLLAEQKHNAIVAMNYLDKLLKKERNEKFIDILLAAFARIQDIAKAHEVLHENVIGVYHTIVNKFLTLPPNCEQFAVDFSSYERMLKSSYHTQFYYFMNKLLRKMDNHAAVQKIFSNFELYLMNESEKRIGRKGIQQLTFIMGQMVLENISIQISQNFVDFVFMWVMKKNKENSDPSNSAIRAFNDMLFLSLHLIYLKPAQIREYLLAHDSYYSYMMRIFSAKYLSKLQRKVVVLALQELLSYEPEKKLSKQILKFCLKILWTQKERYSTKVQSTPRKRDIKDPTMRGMLDFNFKDEDEPEHDIEERRARFRVIEPEERMENSEEKENNEDYKGFMHPFEKFDQFEMFKIRVRSMNWRELVEENDMMQLQNLFFAEWHKDSVRKIVKIKRDG